MTKSIFVIFWTLLLFAPILISCQDQDDPKDPHGVDDPEAQVYRMFIDDGAGDLVQKKFKGQIRLTDWEALFGSVDQIPTNNQGNKVAGWYYKDNKLWRYMAGPNNNARQIITMGDDGTTSAATDLNGDNIADLLDIRMADRQRFTFVTEALGLDFFESWILGNNPFCREQADLAVDYPLFGCEDNDSDGSSGGLGAPPRGVPDLLETLCADYYQSEGRTLPNVASHAIQRNHVTTREAVYNDEDILERRVTTSSTYREDGTRESTTRIIYNYDTDGTTVDSTVIEQIDEHGNGTRNTHKFYNGTGSSGTELMVSESKETFTTDPDAYLDDGKNMNPPEGIPTGGDTTYPGPVDGPFGPDADLAAWCDAQVPYESGAEAAARKDPAAFRVSCDDLVGGGSGRDCTIIEWASPEDFNGVIEPPTVSTGCGPFEEPGPDGTCGGSSAMQRLRGLTAEILSANLGSVVICDPLVCRGFEDL